MSWNFDEHDLEQIGESRGGWPVLLVLLVILGAGLLAAAVREDKPPRPQLQTPSKVGCAATQCVAMTHPVEIEGQCYCLYHQ